MVAQQAAVQRIGRGDDNSGVMVGAAVGRVPWLVFNGWALGALVLLVAGLFQFSGLKRRCLERCHSPLAVVTGAWRGRHPAREAWRLGLAHGAFCVGCCWALMLIMFVVGTGNLGWMLALALVMAAEKNLPWGRRLSAPLGAALIAWGTDPLAVAAFSAGPPLVLGGAVVVRQGVWVLAVAAVVFAALWWFFTRTYAGAAVQACAVNPRAARLMGIRVERVALLAWALAGAVGATAGAVIAPITYATYDMGLMLGLKGFVAAVLGGLVSPPAAIAGGFLLGVVESLAAGLVSSAYKDAVAFVVLVVVWAWLILVRHLPAGWPHVLYAVGMMLVIRGIALWPESAEG